MNTNETKNKIRERMYAVIDLVECEESAQIAVDKNYINCYANKLHNVFCDNIKAFIDSWYRQLMNELNELRIGSIKKSNIILKINNCAVWLLSYKYLHFLSVLGCCLLMTTSTLIIIILYRLIFCLRRTSHDWLYCKSRRT